LQSLEIAPGYSFGFAPCLGTNSALSDSQTIKRADFAQMQGRGGRHTRCGIPTDDNEAVAEICLFMAMIPCHNSPLGAFFFGGDGGALRLGFACLPSGPRICSPALPGR